MYSSIIEKLIKLAPIACLEAAEHTLRLGVLHPSSPFPICLSAPLKCSNLYFNSRTERPNLMHPIIASFTLELALLATNTPRQHYKDPTHSPTNLSPANHQE
jgi:hypothetical protein